MAGTSNPKGLLVDKNKKREEPELLKLLNSRAAWNNPPHVEPRIDDNYRNRMNAAVNAYAQANRTDPFARDRISLHLRRGLELPSDVLEESNSRIRAQR